MNTTVGQTDFLTTLRSHFTNPYSRKINNFQGFSANYCTDPIQTPDSVS